MTSLQCKVLVEASSKNGLSAKALVSSSHMVDVGDQAIDLTPRLNVSQLVGNTVSVSCRFIHLCIKLSITIEEDQDSAKGHFHPLAPPSYKDNHHVTSHHSCLAIVVATSDFGHMFGRPTLANPSHIQDVGLDLWLTG